MSAHGGSTKVIVVALATNSAIAIAKFIAAFISGSASMLAEGIHTLVDCANQVLLLIGDKNAKKPPTPTHPLGFGKESFFWSFVVAILLFSLGGLFAIYEGLHKMSHPEQVGSPVLGLIILAVSAALEGYSTLECMKEIRAQAPGRSLWWWFRHTTSADLLVVFTENAAAMVGLALAAISMILAHVTGNPEWDAIGSVLVGAVLVFVSVLLAIEIKSLMIGEAPSTDFRPFLEKTLAEKIPGATIFNLIALQVGPGVVMLSCKFETGRATDVKALVDGINETERAIKAKFSEVKWLFMEPDHSD